MASSSIGEGSVIEHSVVMGADFFEEEDLTQIEARGLPPLGIGRDCYIKNAIIDKHVEIPEGTSGKLFLDFFQTDKITGEPKGIIALEIGGFDD